MADLFNSQRVVGVVIVDDGTAIYNNQPVIGIRMSDGSSVFQDMRRTVGVNLLPSGSVGIHNEMPVRGAVVVDGSATIHNGLPVESVVVVDDVYEGIFPLYVFDFTRGFISHPITFSRASEKTVIGPDGNPKVIGVNEFPYDWSSGSRKARFENADGSRAADICYITGLSGLDAGYTLYVEGVFGGVDGNFDRVVQLDDGNNNNRHAVVWNKINSKYSLEMWANNVPNGGYAERGDLGDNIKAAFRAGQDDFQASMNGSLSPLDDSANYVTPDRMYLAAFTMSSGGKPTLLDVSKIILFPPDFTGAQLEGLTS